MTRDRTVACMDSLETEVACTEPAKVQARWGLSTEREEVDTGSYPNQETTCN